MTRCPISFNVATMRLTDFRVLTFDCYGTLIDWETGIAAALEPLLAKAPTPVPRDHVMQLFAQHESAQQAETPGMLYPDLLATVHRRLAEALGLPATDTEHRQFGRSIPDWPAFPDSASSLQYLKRHHQLVILSNVDRESFQASNQRLAIEFDAVYTAQDIGSYKPDPKNFNYMLDHLARRGLGRNTILHTAQSLFHDHAPAKQLGLATAWIDRRHDQDGWGATTPPGGDTGGRVDFRFTSMADMVRTHRDHRPGTT